MLKHLNRDILVATMGITLMAGSAGLIPNDLKSKSVLSCSPENFSSIVDLIGVRKPELRAQTKSSEIAKRVACEIQEMKTNMGYSEKYGVYIQIESIDVVNGDILQVYARAFDKDGRQYGFGKDGSVDIERFLIQNPPVLVDDPNGDIIRYDKEGKVVRKLRENVITATVEGLAHTITLAGKIGTEIKKGKYGNTTSTFYPDAHPESNSVDGVIQNSATDTYANVRTASAGSSFEDESSNTQLAWVRLLDGAYLVQRSFFLFNTASIPDDETINSATLSLCSNGSADNDDAGDYDVVSSSPASNTGLALDDFDQVGSTVFASVVYSSWDNTDGNYNDFSLNASGIANISNTGVSKFAFRSSLDTDGIEPTDSNRVNGYFADQAGTTSDPKLVVTHETPSTGGGRKILFIQ